MASTILSTAASIGAQKLFGGSKGGGSGFAASAPNVPIPKVIKDLRANTDAFGLSASLNNGGSSAESNLVRKGSLAQNAFNSRFPLALDNLDALKASLTPGFSQLRNARVNAVRNRATSAISNLSDNLARRRVLGSSFGQDALARTEREFAQAEAEENAKAFIGELQANQAVIQQEQSLIDAALNRELGELGIATGFSQSLAAISQQGEQLAASIASGNASRFLQGSQFNAGQAAQSQAGLGQLAGLGFGGLGGFSGGPGGFGGFGSSPGFAGGSFGFPSFGTTPPFAPSF